MKLISISFRIILMLTVLGCAAEIEHTPATYIPEGFTSYYDEGTDGYMVDLIGYQHPDWSYDKIEDNMFLSDEDFDAKYPDERAKAQTELHWRSIQLLHTIMMSDTTYWKEVIMNTPEYKALDLAKEGDWEDFYFDWNTKLPVCN